MEANHHIDKALAFMESLEKLGQQLQTTEDRQRILLTRMIELKNSNMTVTDEYRELSQRSEQLQDMIDKWRPIYLERMEMVKEVRASCQEQPGHTCAQERKK